MITERVREFIRRLNFTPTERKVVIVLIGAFLVGLGIQFFRSAGRRAAGFDYSAADSEFVARSALPASNLPGVPGGNLSGDSGRRRPAADRPAVGLVRINSATKFELMTLPGVGEIIAERIIRYRLDHGGFTSVRDLLRVKGIGAKKLEHLAPFCVVEN